MTAGTVICDLDGVVYLGDQEVTGAGSALTRLAEAGFSLLFCTNNSSRTRADVLAKIERVTGFRAEADKIFTSAMAGADLAEPRFAAYVLGGRGIVEALDVAGIDVTDDWRKAGTVLVGLDHELTYPRLAGATLAVRNGARLIATNHDPTYPTPEGLQPGAGALVAAVETATEVRAVMAGKPHEPMRRLLRSAVEPGPVWVVGDRSDTDLAMAVAEGWTSVLALSGVTSQEEGVDPPPDMVVRSLAELPGILGVG